MVSPTVKEELKDTSGGVEPVLRVTNIFVGTMTVGLEVYPVPKLVTSNPLIAPRPSLDHAINVAPVPC